MKITRREFMAAVAAAAVVSQASGNSSFVVHRGNMWSPDRNSDETLVRCNRLLAANPNDVLALLHRGQMPFIYYDPNDAWADLSRAISLEPLNPCVWYIRGACFDRADDLCHAISLLSKGGGDDCELMFMAQRELGSVLQDKAFKS